MSREQLLQGANGFMFVLFTSWAFFQHNDPDWIFWSALYGIAALCCLLFLYDRLPAALPVVYGGLVLLWGLYRAGLVISGHEFIFAENGREMFGSFIVVGWMAFLRMKS